MNEQKYCIDCKFSQQWSSGWSCYSPRNPRDLVSGERTVVRCRDSRSDVYACGPYAVFFLAKEGK